MLTVTLIVHTPAQNLGLGTGARSSVPIDSSMRSQPRMPGEDPGESGAPPRKSQINRRLGLAARNYVKFNPRDFETRGRELRGRFYEIGEPPAPGLKSLPGSPRSGMDRTRNEPSRQWMLWVGIAGAAGASAGALGYYMMTRSHPSSAAPPIILNLSDDPLQP